MGAENGGQDGLVLLRIRHAFKCGDFAPVRPRTTEIRRRPIMNMLKQPSHPRSVLTTTSALVGVLLSAGASQGAELSVTHSTPIAVPIIGVATPYSSTVQVADAAGLVTRVTIGLKLSHTAPNDLDVLLVSPSG